MQIWLCLAAVLGGVAVLLGAFAAHGLTARLEPAALGWFETGARYQMYHALAIGLAALSLRGLDMNSPAARQAVWAIWCFAGGIALFSGSLYLLALTGKRGLGMVTPLGGTLFLAGWVFLALSALKQR